MNEMAGLFAQWQVDISKVRERMYRAPSVRERERWHALWLLAQGWSAARVAAALERDPHTIGAWLELFRQSGSEAMAFEQTGAPPALSPAAQAELKAAVQASLQTVGIELANWHWQAVRAFVARRFGQPLSRSSCLNYLHRLGFVLKWPKKELLKADEEKRAAFVRAYAALRSEAQATGAKLFFVDEAHFRADVEVRRKWVLRGQPALVASTSPRHGEKITYYSAICLETGEVEVMEAPTSCTAQTSVAFLHQLRQKYPQPLIVIWDNGPAHRGEAMRTYLATPNLQLRLVALPAYSPDCNADEAIWHWARAEVTANTCFGTRAKVQQALAHFFAGLSHRTAEAQQRCRTILQARADAWLALSSQVLASPDHVDFTLASV
jgi:transposase